jgi:hypothetical protein
MIPSQFHSGGNTPPSCKYVNRIPSGEHNAGDQNFFTDLKGAYFFFRKGKLTSSWPH